MTTRENGAPRINRWMGRPPIGLARLEQPTRLRSWLSTWLMDRRGSRAPRRSALSAYSMSPNSCERLRASSSTHVSHPDEDNRDAAWCTPLAA